jgi:hypothetical protein
MERGRSARRTNHAAMRSGLKKLLIASLYGEQKKHISMEADLSLFFNKIVNTTLALLAIFASVCLGLI